MNLSVESTCSSTPSLRFSTLRQKGAGRDASPSLDYGGGWTGQPTFDTAAQASTAPGLSGSPAASTRASCRSGRGKAARAWRMPGRPASLPPSLPAARVRPPRRRALCRPPVRHLIFESERAHWAGKRFHAPTAPPPPPSLAPCGGVAGAATVCPEHTRLKKALTTTGNRQGEPLMEFATLSRPCRTWWVPRAFLPESNVTKQKPITCTCTLVP